MTYAISDEDTVFFNENVLTGKNITDTIGRSGSPLANFFLKMDDTSLAATTPPAPEMSMEGGTEYVRHLRVARGVAKGSYTGFDQLKTDPNRKYDKAKFNLAQYYTILPYSGDDLRKFRGAAEQVGKIAEDIKGQIGDLAELIIQGLFNAGSAQALTPRIGIVGDYQEKGYLGLQYFFSTTRTWGGLIDTGNAHWAPKINATAYTTAQLTDPANAAYLPNLIKAQIKAVFVDCGLKPSRLFCGSTLWWMLHDIVKAENKGFNASIAAGTLGIDAMKVYGCEVYEDAFMETYVPKAMYMFTPVGFGGQRNLGICARQDAWFRVGGWKEAYNQDAKVRMIIAHPGLYIDQPRMQAALTALGD